MDDLLFNQIIQSHEKEAEMNFENEFCRLQEENPKKANNINIKRCKFLCSKCGSIFATNSGFSKHILKKRIPCNRVIDQKVYISKHLYILCQKYKELRLLAISDYSDEEFKKRMLIGVFRKANEMLKLCELNKEFLEDADDIIYSIKVIIQNMRTGDYENIDLS